VATTAGNFVSYKKDAAKEINIFIVSSLNSLYSTFTQTQNSGTENVRNFIFKNAFAQLPFFSHQTCLHSL